MVDDVLSLVLLAVVRKSTTTFVDVAKPVGASAAVVVVGVGLAALTPRVVARRPAPPDLLVAAALALGAGAAFAADKAGSTPLLGCFVGGVCFASVDGVARRFDEVVVPPASWLYRVFCLDRLCGTSRQARVRAGGALRAAFEPRGCAHEGRHGTVLPRGPLEGRLGDGRAGELGFVMALETFRSGRTSRLALSVTVWALLVATLVSPVVLRRLLARGDGVEGGSRRTRLGAPRPRRRPSTRRRPRC